MKHCMKLFREPFEMIESGEKTIELRLYDEKRKLINVGDTVIFTCIDDSSRSITAAVLELHLFNSFEALYQYLPLEKCGYRAGEKASPKDMEKYYSREEQDKYGVVGIEIELMPID